MEQRRGSHQVLGQVAQQWHRPADVSGQNSLETASVWDAACFRTVDNPPFIYFLEEAAGSVTGGEDSLVRRDTRS